MFCLFTCKASVGLDLSFLTYCMGCRTASKRANRDVSPTSDGLPMRASIYLAVTPAAPLAEYIPNARRDKPPAAVNTLSQSVKSASAPAPSTDPAVL